MIGSTCGSTMSRWKEDTISWLVPVIQEGRKYVPLLPTSNLRMEPYVFSATTILLKEILNKETDENRKRIRAIAQEVNTKLSALKKYTLTKVELLKSAHLFKFMDLRGCLKNWNKSEIELLLNVVSPKLKCLILDSDPPILSLPESLKNCNIIFIP